MANPSRPRSMRRLGLVLVGIALVCLCGVIGLVLFVQTTAVSRSSSVPKPTPPLANSEGPTATLPTSGVLATSVAVRTAMPAPTVTSAAPVEPATGELHFDYPLSLRIAKDEIVRLEIVPDHPVALASAGPVAPSARLLIETGPNDAPQRSVTYSIPLYPVMSAELATARSDRLHIAAGSESKQTIDPFDRNFWTWSMVADEGGEYRITLRVFGYNALTDADPVRQVVDDTRIVQVQERPFLERFTTGLAENWLVLFGAGGPIALVLAILTFWYARRESNRPKV